MTTRMAKMGRRAGEPHGPMMLVSKTSHRPPPRHHNSPLARSLLRGVSREDLRALKRNLLRARSLSRGVSRGVSFEESGISARIFSRGISRKESLARSLSWSIYLLRSLSRGVSARSLSRGVSLAGVPYHKRTIW